MHAVADPLAKFWTLRILNRGSPTVLYELERRFDVFERGLGAIKQATRRQSILPNTNSFV
jgi:hypothetical protein